MKNSSRGFTLIELLVVIAIIGLLASIVLSSLQVARARGRDAQRISDIRQLRNALQLYFTDNGGIFPTTLAALVPTYIPSIPQDPLGLQTGIQCRNGSYCYAYTPNANPTSYHIGAQLEQSNAVLNSDTDCNSNSAGGTGCPVANRYSPTGGSCSLSICAFDGTPAQIYDIAP